MLSNTQSSYDEEYSLIAIYTDGSELNCAGAVGIASVVVIIVESSNRDVRFPGAHARDPRQVLDGQTLAESKGSAVVEHCGWMCALLRMLWRQPSCRVFCSPDTKYTIALTNDHTRSQTHQQLPRMSFDLEGMCANP